MTFTALVDYQASKSHVSTLSLSPPVTFYTSFHPHLSLSPSVPPPRSSVKPIWETCRLGCLLQCPTTVPSPSCHLLVPLQSAAGLPTGQFRWSAVSCHCGHPPWLPLKDNGTVSVTSGSLLYATPLHSLLFHTHGCFFSLLLLFWSIKKKSNKCENASRTHGRIRRPQFNFSLMSKIKWLLVILNNVTT